MVPENLVLIYCTSNTCSLSKNQKIQQKEQNKTTHKIHHSEIANDILAYTTPEIFNTYRGVHEHTSMYFIYLMESYCIYYFLIYFLPNKIQKHLSISTKRFFHPISFFMTLLKSHLRNEAYPTTLFNIEIHTPSKPTLLNYFSS